MRLYVSSAMRSRTIEEYEKTFADATAKLRANGHVVTSPAELNTSLPGRSDEDALRHDFLIIISSIDAIVMLEPWTQSHGARVEHDVAVAIGLKVYYSVDDVPSLARSHAPRVLIETRDDSDLY